MTTALKARRSLWYYAIIAVTILLETPGMGSAACNDMFGR